MLEPAGLLSTCLSTDVGSSFDHSFVAESFPADELHYLHKFTNTWLY